MRRARSSFVARLGSVVVLAVCGGILLLGTRHVMEAQLTPVFNDYEQAILAAQYGRSNQAINAHLDSLVLMAREYAEWDLMHAYALDPAANPDFIAEQMYADSWYYFGIELVLILDAGGELVWGQLTDMDGEQSPLEQVVLPLFTENPLLTSSAGLQSHTRGLLDTPDGILMIASAPITFDDGSGPSVGSLVVGSLFNQARMNSFGRAADANLTLFRLLDPELSDRVRQVPQELELKGLPFITLQTSTELHILSQLVDLYGDPVAVVQATMNGGKITGGERAIQRTLVYLGAGIAIFLLVVALVIFYWGGVGRQRT